MLLATASSNIPAPTIARRLLLNRSHALGLAHELIPFKTLPRHNYGRDLGKTRLTVSSQGFL